jgi:hypothetical protein
MSETRILITLLRMYFPWNWEFGSALSQLRNFGVGVGVGSMNPQTPSQYANGNNPPTCTHFIVATSGLHMHFYVYVYVILSVNTCNFGLHVCGIIILTMLYTFIPHTKVLIVHSTASFFPDKNHNTDFN